VRQLKWFLPLCVLLFFCSQCYRIGPPNGSNDAWASDRRQPISSSGPSVTRTTGTASVAGLMRDANLKPDLVRKGTYGRRVIKPMKARYITIHSTQNYTADAERHAVALKRGALRTGRKNGYMIWHFTVDDRVAIQHLPTSEQGVHADFDGPGNKYSIGIEMCEHRGCSRERTLDRTAKLTAALMKRNGIPLRNVVPHYHWPRWGKNPPNKNCPHFLLDNGRPGKKWRAFLARVNYQYQRLE
jgi:N-acetylmuramoyl-L-alanine amidase